MKRVTKDEFLVRVNNILGKDYEVVGEYKNTNTKINMKHISCGNIYSVTPNKIFSGRQCPYCRSQRISRSKRLSTAEFLNRCSVLLGDEYEILGEYVNQYTPVLIKHLLCGKTYATAPSNIFKGHGCIHCNGGIKHDPEDFNQFVNERTNGEYKVIGSYLNSKSKIDILHTKCGRIFQMSPEKFKYGERCPLCQHSRGEDKIDFFLRKKNIFFERQYKFNDCRSSRSRGNNILRFDFAVFDANKQLLCLIEYDGQQHYIPAHNFGGESVFERTQENDIVKNKYCEKNKIKLIRISYKEYNDIEKILSEYFKNNI